MSNAVAWQSLSTLDMIRDALKEGSVSRTRKCFVLEMYVHFKLPCKDCKEMIDIEVDHIGFCANCYEQEEKITDICEKLRWRRDNCDIEDIWCGEVGDKEISKFELLIADLQIYGYAESQISWEPNEWSSTPHDDYFADFHLFLDPRRRDSEVERILGTTDASK